ncbi:MAG TPA: sensor histidine kinase [Thermoanaerobaculia bacterium]|nr:sensor histidine kinase [Thermoanaerobaculia bacterium]
MSLVDEIPREEPLADFERQWGELVDLARVIQQRGFDRGCVLGATRHEVRGLACHLAGDGRLAVLAGDKHGGWYAGEFDLATGRALALPWHELPPLPCTPRRVINILRVVPSGSGHSAVIGTRGDGAWLAPLEEVLKAGWQGHGLRRLPGCEGAEVRRLLYDRATGQVWCCAGTDLLAWSLAGNEPELAFRERLGYRVTALAIDEGEEGSHDDHLYIATNRSTVHRLQRSPGGLFLPRSSDLAPAASVWQGRASVIEHLRPLSEIRALDRRTGRWKRRFPERGVIGATQRHLVLLEIDRADPAVATSQVWLISKESQVLALEVFCLPGWQAIVASTLDGGLRIFRPSGVRRPPHDELAATPGTAPEADCPGDLLSGFEDTRFLRERVYELVLAQPLPPAGESSLPVLLGMGSHTVRLHRFTLVWELRRRAGQVARTLVESHGPEELLARLQAMSLSSGQRRRDERAILEVLPELGNACASPQHWWRFRLLVWDVLAQHENRSVPLILIQVLRLLQRWRPDQLEALEGLITGIRKFVLDRRSFSEKGFDFLQLASSTDPGLADDRTIYRSILISRRHDPFFSKDFRPADLFGEVRAFAPLPGRGPEGAELAFDCLPPEEMRFLVGTYRRTVWLFDGAGRALRLTGNEEGWGHLQAIHCRSADLVLAFSQAGLRRLPRERLSAPWRELERDPEMRFEPFQRAGVGEPRALSLCPVPGAEAKDERFLWGDPSGRIHLMGPQGQTELADLTVRISPPDRGLAPIHDLRAFTARGPDGSTVPLVAACTGLGSLHLLHWSDGVRPRLEQIEMVWTGPSVATALLIAGSELSQVVVASLDGMVAGYWLLLDPSPSGPPQARLALYWAYRAGEAVRAMQHLDPATAMLPVRPGESMIVVGSYDEHLHILDLLGRHLEIIYLPKVKVDRFAIARARLEDGKLTEARVYACAFENQFHGLRIVSRRRLLAAIDADLGSVDAEEREETLTRWRAFALPEGHLRHRFARQSSRYPGQGARSVIGEIRRLLQLGDSADRPTGMVTALLRRLFQNRKPGAEPGGTEAAQGLREILADGELFVEVTRLLKDLEEQWDTPGSLGSRRVQLFWIRSFLRNLEDLEMLRRWLAIGGELESQTPLAAPKRLLEHFLEHPHDLVQFKVLQYLERLCFGWPGVADEGLLRNGTGLQLEELDCFLSPLLLRLRAHAGAVSRDEPQPAVLQIAKILVLLLRDGHLDALSLSHRLQALEIPEGMYEILIDQCEAMARLRLSPLPAEAAPGDRLRRAAKLLRLERDVEQGLGRGEPVAAVVERIEEILRSSTLDPEAHPEREFLRQTEHYFRTLIPLLRVNDLEALRALKSNSPLDFSVALPSFPSHQSLRRVPTLLEMADQYWNAKYKDLYYETNSLRFEDFDRLRRCWRDLRGELQRGNAEISRRERKLLDLLVRQWDRIIEEEQTQHVLSDIIQMVSELLRNVPEAPLNIVEATALLEKEEGLAIAFFTNLFTRLLLFAEPSTGFFLYSASLEKSVRAVYFERGAGPASYDLSDFTEAARSPRWMDPRWRDRDRFAQLETGEILSWVQGVDARLTWEAEVIPILAEEQRAFGFYCFGWAPEERAAQERFRLNRLTWTVLLQALAFRNASSEQKAIRGRIFSIVAHNLDGPVFQMRSDLKVLVDGFLENRLEARQEKYRELLRQARQMHGIIDGILSLSDRATENQLVELTLADLVYDVVRTMRRDAKTRDIRIEFPKPDRDTQAASRFLTDETKVYDVLLNVLGNAVKYSPPGSTIAVSLRLVHRGAEILVRDAGPGIPKDELALIFEPFFRGTVAVARQVPGLGIGLYVAKLYTEKLNGKINAKNHPDGGATFTIFFPRLESPPAGQA